MRFTTAFVEAAESLIEAKNSGISSSLIITNAEVCAAGTIASKSNRENAGLNRAVNPGQGVRCIVALVLGAGASVRIMSLGLAGMGVCSTFVL